MKHVSIEYAHIYTNQKVSEEHKLSLDILGELRSELNKLNQSSSLVVMVDDYSFPDPSFNYDDFTEWLSEQGHKPDLVVRESQLIPVCDQVVSLISNQDLKEEIISYITSKKYPCSLFIATWYLLRLSCLKSQLFDPRLSAETLVNILPRSFKPYEDKALEIIENTPHKEVASKIRYKFFEGRQI